MNVEGTTILEDPSQPSIAAAKEHEIWACNLVSVLLDDSTEYASGHAQDLKDQQEIEPNMLPHFGATTAWLGYVLICCGGCVR